MADFVDAIWGPSSNTIAEQKRLENLSRYIDYCEDEAKLASGRTVENPTTRLDLVKAIQRLRSRPGDPRVALKDDSDNNGEATAMPLEWGVRLMLTTACLSGGTVGGGDIFRPAWKESESLTRFIDRIYPRSTGVVQDPRSVRVHKMSMAYLTGYASVNVRWTSQLSDHLLLLNGANWKSIYIFRYPAFLTHSIDILRESNPDLEHTTAEALVLGCLPPGLLRETLMTYDLLFPGAGDPLSRTILEKEVARHNLDPYFLKPSRLQDEQHSHFRDALDPGDVKSLYEKYPYWGDRLYDLWKEADDPTPVTGIERWSEARRNPRFTYWCTVVAVGIAITFGMAATTLAAIQVWISYCTWVDDPTRSLCGHR